VTLYTTFGLAAMLVACAPQPPAQQQPAPQQPSARVPYIVPVMATRQEFSSWTEQRVRACFGAPLDSDAVAGSLRYRFQRGACTENFTFQDGKVFSVEGYGAEQECWWVVDACEDSSASHPAAPVAYARAWRAWSMDDVTACFGKPKDVASNSPNRFLVERDDCTIDMDIDNTRRLFMHKWNETEKGACRRLLHKCDAILQTRSANGG
jgi:hypothetical protein